MEYKSIALIGAGAVGSYFIYGFTGLEDISFCLVAEGERKERLERDGININDKIYHPEIKTPEEARGVDLLFVATKYQALTASDISADANEKTSGDGAKSDADEKASGNVLDMIEKIVDDHTVVVSYLNGIDSEKIIGGRIGESHVVYSITRISSSRKDGVIRFVPETTIGMTYGEKNGGKPSPRVEAIVSLMKKAGLRAFASEDIIHDQWQKYSMNIVYNLSQAVLGVGFGAYYDSVHAAAIRDRMYR